MKLTLFINDVERAYREERAKYEELCKSIDDIDGKLSELRTKRNLFSAKGYAEKTDGLMEARRRLTDEIEQIPKEYATRTAAIREKCKDEFSKRYSATPSMVDSNAVLLAQSGLLTIDEFADMAKSFGKNATMLRIIGDCAEKQGDKNGNEALRLFGISTLKSSLEQPHLEVLDGFTSLAGMGLRVHESGDSIDGIRAELSFDETRPLADGYATELHAENVEKYTELADNYES